MYGFEVCVVTPREGHKLQMFVNKRQDKSLDQRYMKKL